MLHESPLKVGYVVKRYPRYSETFIVNEILAHEAAGLDLEVFALRPPADTHFQGAIAQVRAPVHYLPAPSRSSDFWHTMETAAAALPDFWPRLSAAEGEAPANVFQAVLLALAVQDRGLDHLHAHFATSATSVARLASHFTGVSFSFTAHAKDIFHESVHPEDLRRKLSEAANVVTVSDYNRSYLRAHYGQATARLHRIYNGLDLERFPYQSPAQRRPLILGIGRLVEKKGFADLIEACALLAAQGLPFACQIVGSGDQEEDLRSRIEARGLSEQVSLLGPRPQHEIITLLREAAVFAAPCVVGLDGNRDGLPTVLLEAMALGTPCVSTDVTGIPEVLRHEQTGLQVPQHDPVALSHALARLLTDEALRVRLSEHARALMEHSFDIHRNAALIRACFVPSRPPDVPLPVPSDNFAEVH